MVFMGGRETLNRPNAPVILFEAGADSARGFGLGLTEAADYLASLSHPAYQFFEVLEKGALRPVGPSDFKPQYQNLVAVPKSNMRFIPN
jgi:hypothetical protein